MTDDITNPNSITALIETGCGKMYVTIAKTQEGKVKKIFAHMGKGGGCASSQLEALSFLAKEAIRADVPISKIITGLKGIGCHVKTDKATSCSDGFAKILEKHLK